MYYARDCYWIKEKDFYKNVEIPTEEPTDGTENEEKLYWNFHLNELLSLKADGKLLEEVLNESFQSHQNNFVFFVFDFNGKDLFVSCDWFDEEEIKSLELENVTDKYLPIFFETINTKEIDQFVGTHSKFEIEERYCTNWVKEHDSFSMWEL
jgi:hypothetical protein